MLYSKCITVECDALVMEERYAVHVAVREGEERKK
jgi:hypothetical protein